MDCRVNPRNRCGDCSPRRCGGSPGNDEIRVGFSCAWYYARWLKGIALLADEEVMKLLRLSSCCLVALLCLFASGSAPAVAGSATHVYLLRGIFNVSVGLDALAVKLARRGIAASVYGHGEAASVAAKAIGDYRSGKASSIVLIGHSLGAGAAVSVAQRLGEAGVPVTLLISLDPVLSGAVPRNVRRAINFHVSGAGALARGPGFRGGLANVNVGGVSGMNHMAIQATDSMHRRIIGYIK
jgi:hypothetical protein